MSLISSNPCRYTPREEEEIDAGVLLSVEADKFTYNGFNPNPQTLYPEPLNPEPQDRNPKP